MDLPVTVIRLRPRLGLALIVAVVVGCGPGGASALPTSSPEATSLEATPTVGPTQTPRVAISPAPLAIGPDEPWIVYQGGTGGAPRLLLVRPDGMDDHEILPADPGEQQQHPDWSSDGARIAFDRWVDDPGHPGQTRIDLWTVGVDGSDPQQIAACEAPCLQLSYPAWSPDGSKIALMHFDDPTTNLSFLEVLDPATGVRRVVSQTKDGKTAFHLPRWSPDGRSIAMTVETYADDAETQFLGSSIAVVKADGSDGADPTILTPSDVVASAPDWRRSDGRIVFAVAEQGGDQTATSRLFAMDPDGSHMTAITSLDAIGGFGLQPTWTPDSSKIIFTFGPDGDVRRPQAAFIAEDGSGFEAMSGLSVRTHPRLRPTP